MSLLSCEQQRNSGEQTCHSSIAFLSSWHALILTHPWAAINSHPIRSRDLKDSREALPPSRAGARIKKCDCGA
jgi:hypothetical protein